MMTSFICRIPLRRDTHECLWQIGRRSSLPLQLLQAMGLPVSETARLTDRKAELSEDIQGLLDLKQHLLLEHIDEQPEISVTWFQPDARKEGGQYRTVTARLQRVDAYARLLVLTDGTRIPLDDVADLQCPLFSGLQ